MCSFFIRVGSVSGRFTIGPDNEIGSRIDFLIQGEEQRPTVAPHTVSLSAIDASSLNLAPRTAQALLKVGRHPVAMTMKHVPISPHLIPLHVAPLVRPFILAPLMLYRCFIYSSLTLSFVIDCDICQTTCCVNSFAFGYVK